MPKRLLALSKPSPKEPTTKARDKARGIMKSTVSLEGNRHQDDLVERVEEFDMGLQCATVDCLELNTPSSIKQETEELKLIPKLESIKTKYQQKNIKFGRFLSPKAKHQGMESNIIVRDKMIMNRRSLKIPTFTKQDNQKIIRSAIINACLAGEGNKKRREEALEDFKAVPKGRNVIILFKDPLGGRLDIKALYLYNEETEGAEFLYGAKDSPMILGRAMINNYYRYDCGSKSFRLLQGNKNFSIAVDAVTIKVLTKKKSVSSRIINF